MARPKAQTGREHEVGILTAPLLTFNLNREIQQLRLEGRWPSGHTAKTLAKYGNFRVVLIVMKAGGGWTSIGPKDKSRCKLLTGKSGSAQRSGR
jgi:hypothetical protein